MRFLPHIVEFNEKYRDKGLEILMATDIDSAADLEKFIAEKKLKVGIARVADVYKTVAAQGYPTAFGIDVDGKCIWRGHPQLLTEALVDGWLKDLRAPKIPRKLSEALNGAVAAYDATQYGAALMSAEKSLKSKESKAAADAQYVADLLNGRIEMHKTAAKNYRDRGALDLLVPLLEADAKEFSGHAYAKDLDAEAKKVKAGKAYKDCIEARDQLAKLKPGLASMKSDKAKAALEKIAKDYPATPAGKEAGEMAKDLK